ncbi:MAG TPA: hypothetical protein VGK67_38330 [Myxococcales bacterium]|jgi:hypothetical protein
MGSKRDKRREQKRKEKQAKGPEDEYAGVGLLSSMRGGFKSAVGTGGGGAKKGPKTRADTIKEIVTWLLIAALLVLVFYKFGMRGR